MKTKMYIILLILVAIIVMIPLAMYSGLGEDQGYFGGSDDAGATAIESTGYTMVQFNMNHQVGKYKVYSSVFKLL